jgi:hypothetical protein
VKKKITDGRASWSREYPAVRQPNFYMGIWMHFFYSCLFHYVPALKVMENDCITTLQIPIFPNPKAARDGKLPKMKTGKV